jgi:hypothetical protein
MSDDTEHRQGQSDEELLDELRSIAARVEPTPEFVLSAAKAAYTWRTIDDELAELAELTFDSALEEQGAGAVRGDDGPRALTFETPEVTIELEVTVSGDTRSLMGQVVPPEAGRVEIRHTGGIAEADVDDHGRFSVRQIERGPVSIRLHRSSSPDAPVVTDWLSV